MPSAVKQALEDAQLELTASHRKEVEVLEEEQAKRVEELRAELAEVRREAAAAISEQREAAEAQLALALSEVREKEGRGKGS